MTFELSSPAFSNGSPIPRKYSCEGADTSPELRWRGIPPGTKSLALIVDDPDAPDPDAPRMTYVHWVVYNLPPESTGLPPAVSFDQLPSGARLGLNDWGQPGYGGPCPPIGRHRYVHKLYALATMLTGLDRPTKPQLLAAMEGHVLARAELVGTYQKGDQ